jgi:hypothetical protein
VQIVGSGEDLHVKGCFFGCTSFRVHSSAWVADIDRFLRENGIYSFHIDIAEGDEAMEALSEEIALVLEVERR